MHNQTFDPRTAALRRFAFSISVLTLFGHLVLGFEPPLIQVFVAIAVSYTLELSFEALDAWREQRRVRYADGLLALVDFLLPAHITALAIAMLLYANSDQWAVVFAVAISIGSKYIFRAPVNGRWRHFLNPSNTGLALIFVIFPWVGLAPPYQFIEGTSGPFDFLFPLFLVCVGTLLNLKLTGRLPLILGWVGAFVLQGVARWAFLGAPLLATLAPMTGLAFVLFTFYMVSDPGTTPKLRKHQVTFGAAVGLLYGLLVSLHVVFTMFFALFIVCSFRGLHLNLQHWLASSSTALRHVPEHESRGGVLDKPAVLARSSRIITRL